MAIKQPKSSFFHPRRVTVDDASRLLAEGVRAVEAISSSCIRLRGEVFMEILGEGLELLELGNDNMEVRGRIDTLHFRRQK